MSERVIGWVSVYVQHGNHFEHTPTLLPMLQRHATKTIRNMRVGVGVYAYVYVYVYVYVHMCTCPCACIWIYVCLYLM